MATHKVGGDVDAFCTKCKLTLAHTVVAMVGSKVARVRCNTCGGDHAYRGEPGAKISRAAAPRRRPDKSEKVVVSFEQRLAGRSAGSAKKYSPSERFRLDDVVDHPTFGLGIVSGVREDKVDITFKAAMKTLIHGRGESGGPARPSFHPPNAIRRNAPADKPLDPDQEEASAPEAEAVAEAEAEPLDSSS